MIKGKIININSTKYIVATDNGNYDCTLRGIFRKQKITPFVGDNVDINEKDNQIINVYPRTNELRRPFIANVDYAIVITSVKKPDLDLVLLDKLLVSIFASNIKPIICFTKVDLLNDNEKTDYLKIKDYYQRYYEVIENTQIDDFKIMASNKTLVLCGQTGSGKSSFINKISDLDLKTNPISDKLNRGIHTTRYVTLYRIDNFLIADSPGFSALDVNQFEKEDIKHAFLEFDNYECKYRDCNHLKEDGCKIINNDNIMQSRIDNYHKFIKEKDESSRKLFK